MTHQLILMLHDYLKGGKLMKRLLLISSILFMMTILVGCINLKIGDDILKISEDGIELIKGGTKSAGNDANKDDQANGSHEEQETNDKGEEKAGDSSDNQQTNTGNSGNSTGTNQDDSGKATDKTKNPDTEQSQGKASDGTASKGDQGYACPEGFDQDYSEIREKLNHEFYFPECSHVESVEDTGSTLKFVLHHDPKVLTLEDKNDELTQAILNIHHTFEELGNVYDAFPNFGLLRGYSYFYLHGDNKGDTKVDYEYDIHTEYMVIEVVYTYP